jgi:hypothetical protein
MKKLGTGGGDNKIVHPNVRTGSGSKGSSPAAASQLGQSTAFKKEQVDAGRGYDGAKYGNEIALNAAGNKAGPGAGRQVMRCGSQGQHGAPAPGSSPQPRHTMREYGPDIPGRK